MQNTISKLTTEPEIHLSDCQTCAYRYSSCWGNNNDFSLILGSNINLALNQKQSSNILNPYTILGFLAGGSVYIGLLVLRSGSYNRCLSRCRIHQENIHLDEVPIAVHPSNIEEVVKICTQYAQTGMFNIFIAIFSFALAFAFFAGYRDTTATTPIHMYAATSFFVSYLIRLLFSDSSRHSYGKCRWGLGQCQESC